MADPQGLGPTGDFPQGRLNPSDEGGLRFAVGVENGKVVIHFGKGIEWIGLDVDTAEAFANALRSHAATIRLRRPMTREEPPPEGPWHPDEEA